MKRKGVGSKNVLVAAIPPASDAAPDTHAAITNVTKLGLVEEGLRANSEDFRRWPRPCPQSSGPPGKTDGTPFKRNGSTTRD